MKRYSKSEPKVFAWIGPPYIFFMNLIIFGWCPFNSPGCFLKIFIANTIYFFVAYGFFGSVAVTIQKKYPAGADLFKRIRIMLPIFYFLNMLAIYGNYHLFSNVIHLGCRPDSKMIWWGVLYGCIMSTLITFINEGFSNWNDWKASLSENEKLKNAYQRSKLLGLKGQLNPHFLFNCFNTLSGMIEDDHEEAENFLDEMTKVHRYLLRGGDELLVPLSDEVRFARSYLYLTKARFGPAVEFSIAIDPALLKMEIPPLSLHVILENIIYNNTMSKRNPLIIEIRDTLANEISVSHNVLDKVIVQSLNQDEGLDNLIRKYRLLGSKEIVARETMLVREITLPLFTPKLLPA